MAESQLKYGVKLTVPDKKAAEQALQALQTEFEEVPSAYVPSGIVPPAAMLWMLLAALLGGAAAAVVGSLGVALTLGCVVGGAAFFANTAKGDPGARGAQGVVAAVLTVVFLGASCASFVVAGLFAGRLTAAVDRRVANRNRKAAGGFAALAGCVAILLLAYLLPLGVRHGWALLDIPTGDVSGAVAFGWFLFAIGAVILLAIAVDHALEEFSKRRFCESCSVVMSEPMRGGMTWAGARALKDSVARGVAADLAASLREQRGLDVLVTAWKCPRCGIGFLECRAHFDAEWQEGGNSRRLTRQWLIASVTLTRPQLVQMGV